MANPLFQMMGGMMGGNNIMGMLSQLKQNPMALLNRAGYNVPGNITGPQQIVQHLVQSGQVNQSQLDYAQQMAQMFGGLK